MADRRQDWTVPPLGRLAVPRSERSQGSSRRSPRSPRTALAGSSARRTPQPSDQQSSLSRTFSRDSDWAGSDVASRVTHSVASLTWLDNLDESFRESPRARLGASAAAAAAAALEPSPLSSMASSASSSDDSPRRQPPRTVPMIIEQYEEAGRVPSRAARGNRIQSPTGPPRQSSWSGVGGISRPAFATENIRTPPARPGRDLSPFARASAAARAPRSAVPIPILSREVELMPRGRPATAAAATVASAPPQQSMNRSTPNLSRLHPAQALQLSILQQLQREDPDIEAALPPIAQLAPNAQPLAQPPQLLLHPAPGPDGLPSINIQTLPPAQRHQLFVRRRQALRNARRDFCQYCLRCELCFQGQACVHEHQCLCLSGCVTLVMAGLGFLIFGLVSNFKDFP